MNRTSRVIIRLVAAAVLLTSLSLMAGGAFAHGKGHGHGHKPPSKTKTQVEKFDHVFWIMMENTGYNTLIGNPNAPWINAAAKKFGVATNYYGVTHPSQPNYIASTSGSTNGVTTDNDTNVTATNIVDQLEAHHKTWRAYMQSLNDCLTGVAVPTTVPGETNYKFDHACGNKKYGAQLYQRKHDPFVSYTDNATNPARMADVVDFSQLKTDLNHNAPNFAWISPDQCHDMHGVAAPTPTDPCDFSQVPSLIKMGDHFLKKTVHLIRTSHAWGSHSIIFITWDESDYTGTGPSGFGDTSGCCDANPGGGHVLTLVITGARDKDHGTGDDRNGRETDKLHQVSDRAYNHYSILSTIEHSWKLGCLGFTCDTKNVKPMTDLAGDK